MKFKHERLLASIVLALAGAADVLHGHDTWVQASQRLVRVEDVVHVGLFLGQPLADHRVTFVPRGSVVGDGFDPESERMTDAHRRCSFEPREGNLVLVVAHLDKPDEKGEGYERTVYSATLVIDVPQRCQCCDQ